MDPAAYSPKRAKIDVAAAFQPGPSDVLAHGAHDAAGSHKMIRTGKPNAQTAANLVECRFRIVEPKFPLISFLSDVLLRKAFRDRAQHIDFLQTTFFTACSLQIAFDVDHETSVALLLGPQTHN